MTQTFSAAGHAWTVDPAYEGWVREVLAAEPRALEALPGARVIKINRVRTVVHVPGPQGGLYLKRFRTLRAVDRWLSVIGLRRSPARREFEAFQRLQAAGVPCPQPVVLGEERRGGKLVGSVLATREADQAACESRTSVAAATCVTILLGDKNAEFPWLLDQCMRAYP